MNKYTFWIAFISVITFGLIITSSVLSYAWVNFPTTWNFEFGFDDDSIDVIDRTIDNVNRLEEEKYDEEIWWGIDEVQE